MKLFSLGFCVVLLSSCSNVQTRNKERELQTQIIHALNQKVADFGVCAKKHELYNLFNSQRIRIELQLRINHQGQMDSFQLDNKPYPEKFVDCMFNVADLIIFPALDKGEVVELTQPIIFTNN
jgi:hypothetical protein